MREKRAGEGRCPPIRSERLFEADGAWWFEVRHGAPNGPFAQKGQAEVAMACYVAGRIVMEGAAQNIARKRLPHSLDAMVEEAMLFERTADNEGLTRALGWLQERIAVLRDSPNDFSHATRRMLMLRHLEAQTQWPQLSRPGSPRVVACEDDWDDFASADDWDEALE